MNQALPKNPEANDGAETATNSLSKRRADCADALAGYGVQFGVW